MVAHLASGGDAALGAIVVSPEPAANLPLLGVALAALLYWLGGRRHRRLAASRGGSGWRTAAFVAALVVVVIALGQPLDGAADKLFWAHMLEHVLLLVVVAPLLALAAPWMRLWRAFPLRWRRPIARSLAHGRWAAPLRGTTRWMTAPLVAWGLLNLDVVGWHVPAMYDLTLRSEPIHDLEHVTFLAFALLAWTRVIDSPPLRSRLTPPGRAALALGSMFVGWALAIALAMSARPWYVPYAEQHHRPGGITALADQQIGAGIMWVPASIPWMVAIVIVLYRWVGEQSTSTPDRNRITKRTLSRT